MWSRSFFTLPPRLPRLLLSTASTASTACCALVLGAPATKTARAEAPPPKPTNNWNQWDDDARDGVVEGQTKLALGVDYARVGGSEHTVRLSLELVHLLRNHWGLVGALALPLEGQWVAPASLGIRFHFVPKFPLAAARAGLAFHYFGLFFAQIEGGYDFVHYGREGINLDVGGASFSGRLGVSF